MTWPPGVARAILTVAVAAYVAGHAGHAGHAGGGWAGLFAGLTRHWSGRRR